VTSSNEHMHFSTDESANITKQVSNTIDNNDQCLKRLLILQEYIRKVKSENQVVVVKSI